MTTFEVQSELYTETDFDTTHTVNGNSISKFTFVYPKAGLEEKRKKPYNGKVTDSDSDGVDVNGVSYGQNGSNGYDDSAASGKRRQSSNANGITNGTTQPTVLMLDKDGDSDVERKTKGFIEIEHQKSTKLDLVGLQIWRGALLLADYILHNEKKFKNRKILELGSGVGLTSIVSSFYAREVICTDINVGGLLDLIQANIDRNAHLKDPNCNVIVSELDFKVSYENFSDELKAQLQDVEFVICADVIYDDEITNAFVLTLESLLLELPKLKGVYIALEKRYVFTLEDMDSVAPSYEHFLRVFYRRNNRFGITRWKLMQVTLSAIPRYFEYEKVNELVLLKICN